MKILVTDKIADEAINMLKKEHEVTFSELTKEELLEEVEKYHALIVRSRTKVTKNVIECGKNLKVIGRSGIGVDNIDVDTATAKKIPVVNAPMGATISVAELTFAHIFALLRKINIADSTMKEGKWLKKQLMGEELYGKTLGLIGSGRIAQHVAKIANGIGMKVIVYSPHITEEKSKQMGAVMMKDLDTLLKESDIVSLHIPYTKETHHLINGRRLSLMKKHAYIINCARGGVVDEKALYEYLVNRRIAGAALDVFETEPPGDNKLVKLENVVVTPHIGASTYEGQVRASTITAQQVLAVLRNEKPVYCVNMEVFE